MDKVVKGLEFSMLTDAIKEYIETSILGWLATVDEHGSPSVSPKEVFTYNEEDVLIAHIVSPNSIKNIKSNARVCFSFVDIFRQKGYKLFGTASIISRSKNDFEQEVFPLKKLAGDKFSIHSIIKIKVDKAEPIIAPSYRYYPQITEQDQIVSAKQAYDLLYQKVLKYT